MAGVRVKSLQAATPLLNEQFDQMLFVVNLAQPNTTLCQTGAKLKTAVVLSQWSGTAFFDENMHGMLTKERRGVAN